MTARILTDELVCKNCGESTAVVGVLNGSKCHSCNCGVLIYWDSPLDVTLDLLKITDWAKAKADEAALVGIKVKVDDLIEALWRRNSSIVRG